MTPRAVHIVPELRAVHVERYTEWAPDDVILYRGLKWDLDSLGTANAQHLTIRSLAKTLRDRSIVVVELPEPLWMREALFTAVVAILTRALRGRSVRLVAYCMENNDFAALVGYSGPFGALVRAAVAIFVRTAIGRHLDRIAFGSDGSRELYEQLAIAPRALSATILELPKRAETLRSVDTDDVLFVGRLEPRKGVIELMRAWERVETATNASITLVGDGPLAQIVDQWISENPSRRRSLKHVPHSEIASVYASNAILAAPSRREGRWREQIGLPICEALSHGLTVVTTSETGLASWLTTHGHSVVAPEDCLADVLRERLASPLEPTSVVNALPDVGGRRSSDDWLRS